MTSLSVVIPIKDERDNLRPLHERLRRALDPLLEPGAEAPLADYEVLFDIPRPEKWEMDVWVTFGAHPPIGMAELVTWVQATGLQNHVH